MKSILLFVAMTAIAGVVAAAGFKGDVAGKWSLSVAAPGEAVEVLLDLKQDGESVTGTMTSGVGGGPVTKGTFKDKKLSATITADIQGSRTELGVEGTVDGDTINGTITAHGLGNFAFAGTRAK